MDIPALAGIDGTTSPGATAASDTGTMVASDFETFLKMMTTQMQNQDPLNPMESTEFATQLATFSGVEQQVRTNELLADLGSAFATMQMGQLANWIGLEAQASMPVGFDGTPITVSGTPGSLADRMELVVRDGSDRIVQQVPIPLSDDPVSWSGIAADGTTLQSGTYTLSIQNWAGETMLDEQPALIHARIEEARIVDGAVWVTMEDGQSVPASDIVGLGNGA